MEEIGKQIIQHLKQIKLLTILLSFDQNIHYLTKMKIVVSTIQIIQVNMLINY